MSSSMTITPELLAGFLDEAPEYLEMLDEGLMDFESKAGSGVLSLAAPEDQEQMNTMFRAAHSLKGLAAAFGFDKIKELTHRMETLFDEVRMQKRSLSEDSFETLFRVFDRLRSLVEELKDPSGTPIDTEDILKELDRILEAPVGQMPAETDHPTSSSADETPAPVAAGAHVSGFFDDVELASLFVETTAEAIDELNQGLLGLEESPGDAELLNQVFRCAHNIKGASGAVGLDGMNRLTHEIETVFDRLRSDQVRLDEKLMNAVFQAVDQLRAVVDELKLGRVMDVSSGDGIEQFAAWLSTPSDRDLAAPTSADDGDPGVTVDPGGVENGGRQDPREGASGSNLIAIVEFAEGFAEASVQAYLIYNKLLDLAEVISSDPDIETMTGDSTPKVIKFVIESSDEPGDIERILSSYDVEKATVTPIGGDVVEAPSGTNAETQPKASEPPASPTRDDSRTPQIDSASATPVQRGSSPSVPSSGPTVRRESPTLATQNVKTLASRSEYRKGGKTDSPSKKPGETLRVDQERLDHLMNLGGELVINKARFLQVHQKFQDVLDGRNLGTLVDDITDHLTGLTGGLEDLRAEGGHQRALEEFAHHLLHLRESIAPIRTLVQQMRDLRTPMFDFDEAIYALTRVSQGIQKGIMDTRMMPIGPMFNRFKRVVRDIAKSNGKQINLVLRGENTELDKRMIDELGDPLTHMVRNSGDHGIETPEVREAAGKSPVGTLILEAFHRGNSICIEAIDDGAGVNLERVRAKVIERELATEAQVEQMTDRELVQYVFKPGFSTAQKVTDVSGRGMGMDIVVNKIEKLSGTIEMDSVPGQGTRVTIKLPLTLAILNSLVARINECVFAIPLESVAEIITVRKEDIRCVQRRQVVQVRERVVPLAWFEDVFDTKLEGLQTTSRGSDEVTLVIITVDNNQIGLVVDELLGQEEVVIKSIAEHYRNVRGIAGASIRGDGTVSLILDVVAVLEMTGKVGRALIQPVEPVMAEA